MADRIGVGDLRKEAVMQGPRSKPLLVLVAIAVLTVPILPAAADTIGTVVFTDGKAFVQCPAGPGEPTGIGIPGLGINKGDKCSFVFSSKNVHKNDIHTCTGVATSNTVKKGSAKDPVAAGGTVGKVINECEIAASGVIGPKFKTPLPPPLTGGGPWCKDFHGIAGSGAIKIGPKAAPVKRINFDNLRMQVNGGLGIVTARAFKDDPGTANPGQSGPLLGIIHWEPDEHKIAQGVPNTSCLTGNKNFKVSGLLLFALLGNK